MREIQIFMYHGAEHKAINCIEHGFELKVENIKWQSKEHKRCGTSFMLFVMVISLIVFILLPPLDIIPRIVSRILLVPIISGISYEFIRFAGKTDNILVEFLSKPGMALQKITTKEPDNEMIEVAIQSLEAVFDWKEFVEEVATTKKPVPCFNIAEPEKVEEEPDTQEGEEDDILLALDKYLD